MAGGLSKDQNEPLDSWLLLELPAQMLDHLRDLGAEIAVALVQRADGLHERAGHFGLRPNKGIFPRQSYIYAHLYISITVNLVVFCTRK